MAPLQLTSQWLWFGLFFLITWSLLGAPLSYASTEPLINKSSPLSIQARAQAHAAPRQQAMHTLHELIAGNHRFFNNQSVHPRQNLNRIERLALEGQHPVAVVITCSDSRLSPELLFDEGLGDLFEIRTAGNVVDEIGLGSVEYAVDDLEVPLIIVLGHQHCGAVTAALNTEKPETLDSPNLRKIVTLIRPAIEEAEHQVGVKLENAVRDNVHRVATTLLEESTLLSKAYDEQKLLIVEAYYELGSGRVEILDWLE